MTAFDIVRAEMNRCAAAIPASPAGGLVRLAAKVGASDMSGWLIRFGPTTAGSA